jgi:hypothetical protein
MLKWLVRFLYIMIVSIATVYVYGSANYSRLEAYYTKYMQESLDDTTTYLKGINTLMGIDYYREISSVSYASPDDQYQMTLGIYAIGATFNDTLYDGVMIFVNDVVITESGEQLINPILKLSVKLSEPTYKSGETFTDVATVIFDPTKEFPYSYVPAVFLLKADNYLKVIDSDVIATIERFSVAYSSGETNDAGAYIYSEILLFAGANEVIADASHLKISDFDITTDSYSISALLEGDQPSEAEIQTLGLITVRGDLKEFNGLIWRTMIIYALVVLALTYVLFFNKYVMDKIKEKRTVVPSSGVKKFVDAEPIFKDIDSNKEDGK